MIRVLFFAITIILIVSCGNKDSRDLSKEGPVEVSEFISSFQKISPPYDITEATLNRKETDSASIHYSILTQFVPDSFITTAFGKTTRPQFHALRRVQAQNGENYVFVKAVQGKKKVGYLFAFDASNLFLGGMALVNLDSDPATQQSGGIDRRFTIHRTLISRRPDGSMAEGKDVFVLNSDSKQFMLIVTDALDDRNREIVNPIDTLPRKNKYSGDYARNSRNFVSVRDSDDGQLMFFIHFQNNSATCSGELKGEAKFTATNRAIYRSPGDPCELQLTFSSSAVSVREVRACGNHRDLKCSFDGSFPKKKELKLATKGIKK